MKKLESFEDSRSQEIMSFSENFKVEFALNNQKDWRYSNVNPKVKLFFTYRNIRKILACFLKYT